MDEYNKQIDLLNEQQLAAVKHTEGPVLVIAGPGTGKTQLLSARAAYILQNTDAKPHNILCLTYTESGEFAMRQRLVNIIGQKAYNITISTYHGFGSELINKYPEHFSDSNDLVAVDALGIHSIVSQIIEKLPYDNPLKKSEYYIKDVIGAIGDFKKALLKPNDVRAIAESNAKFIKKTSTLTRDVLSSVKRIDKKSLTAFTSLYQKTKDTVADEKLRGSNSLTKMWQAELQEAIESAQELNKTSPLTEWKNNWLERDEQGHFVVQGKYAADKLMALADIYDLYLHELEKQGLFDYDDMILRAIEGLKTNKALRFSLQEQYLYVMLDEFQDTNGAQLELIKLLTDSPVYEGAPNVLAVGDDDQAIYSFQGADYSHMATFKNLYKNTRVICLTKNYRSHKHILETAHNISSQIETRLHKEMSDVNKILSAESSSLPANAEIERHEFKSDVAQFAWVTKQIQHLIKSGINPKEIAILAPKHKFLEPVLPYLAKAKIPVRYEKREDILSDPKVTQIIRMSQLVLALRVNDMGQADSLWPEVLSYDFWQHDTEDIWDMSWQASDSRTPWTELIMKSDKFSQVGLFFFRLSNISSIETLESTLDYITGNKEIDLGNKSSYVSPYFEFNFGTEAEKNKRQDFWDLLSNLTVLRQHLREHRGITKRQLYLKDLIDFVDEHTSADIKILNTSPYHEQSDSVQIMSAYKAKGLEFEAVFMLACIDEVWGSKARSQSSKIPLPKNLAHIRYSGATDDEKLRLIFVAITRAKHRLYMTSYANNYSNRPTTRVKYFNEIENDGEIVSEILPSTKQQVSRTDAQHPTIEDLSSYWADSHLKLAQDVHFKNLLIPRLEKFRLAPTNLNAFTDIIYGGPKYFFTNTLLKFPSAPTPAGEFGNVIHEIIEWIHVQLANNDCLPAKSEILKKFAINLSQKNISENDQKLLLRRGQKCVEAFVDQKSDQFSQSDIHEFNFKNEGVLVGPAHLTGKIDKMIINKESRTITIIDFKTGKSFDKWKTGDSKLHKYKQQLYFYKLLVEGSYTFSDYKVTDAYLQFVEPNDDGKIVDLHVDFASDDLKRIRDLAIAVWKHVQALSLPDISRYKQDLSGILQFEDDLIKNSP